MKKTRQHKSAVAYRVCIGVQSLLLLAVVLLGAIAAKGAPATVSTEPASSIDNWGFGPLDTTFDRTSLTVC